MKKIGFILFFILSVFIIFMCASNEKIKYLSIGDTLNKGVNSYNVIGYGYNNYVKNYLFKNNLIRDFNDYYYNNSIIGFTDDIRNNQTIIIDKEYYLKKLLRESDVLVIGLGMDELAYYFHENNIDDTYKNFNKILVNLQDFINEVMMYAKGKILFLGYYNPTCTYNSDIDELFYYVETSLKKMFLPNKIELVALYEKVKSSNYMECNGNYHLNTNGYLMVATEIIKYIEQL